MTTLSDIFASLDVDPRGEPTKEEATVFKADGCFDTAAAALSFLMAGNATATFVSKKTGSRFTYKVKKPDDGDGSFLFVSLLTGPDNWANYKYFGYIRRGIYFHGGAKAKVSAHSPGAAAFNWTFAQLSRDNLPDSVEVWHEGKCGRCGRKLTVPSSIASGFGPECAGKI